MYLRKSGILPTVASMLKFKIHLVAVLFQLQRHIMEKLFSEMYLWPICIFYFITMSYNLNCAKTDYFGYYKGPYYRIIDYLGILKRITDYLTLQRRIIDYLDWVLGFKDIHYHSLIK